MYFFSRDRNGDGPPLERIVDQGMQMRPNFLKNIVEATNFLLRFSDTGERKTGSHFLGWTGSLLLMMSSLSIFPHEKILWNPTHIDFTLFEE